MKSQFISILIASTLLMSCNPGADDKSESAHNTSPGANDFNLEAERQAITEKSWTLLTLGGQEVIMANEQEKEAQFTLKTDGNSVVGFAGCNSFNGTYTLEKGYRIRFSNMAVTMKACAGIESEGEFLEVFELADNYTIHNDTLSLNVGRRAPLAVFSRNE